jgi:long-chain acyl-CoA synthetase
MTDRMIDSAHLTTTASANLVVTTGLANNDRGDRTAIVDGQRFVTYGELAATAERTAGSLQHSGIKRGDSVLFWAGSRVEHVTTYLGCAWIGAVFAPVHPTFGRRELEFIAEVCPPQLAIVERSFASAYSAAAKSSNGRLPEHFVLLEDGSDVSIETLSWSPFEQWLAESVAVEIAEVTPDTPVLTYFSSGTTARPKPILMSHGAQTWNAHTYLEVQDYRHDDVVLDTMPLSWAYGLSCVMMPMLTAGGTVAILTRFRGPGVLAEIERLGVTLFPGTATMFASLLEACNGDLSPLATVRHMYVGGEPRNEPVIAALEKFMGHPMIESWAASEAHPVASTGGHLDAPQGSIGKPVPGAEIRIVDSEGNDVAVGETGEALIRCPGQMLRYLGAAELTTDKVTPEGWLKSGDLARRDENGFLFIIGRISNLIIRGGTNIAPAEIEDALREIDGVADAGVVGIPDPTHGETVVALVVCRPAANLSGEEIRAKLRGSLATYKIPQHVHIVADLPIVTSGKKSVAELKERAIILNAAAALSEVRP